MMDRNISDVEFKPLWVLKSSINAIAKILDVKKCLRTEGDGLFRDWRGLEDTVNEGRLGSDRIVVDPNSSKSKTSQIVQQWCRQEGEVVTIKKLLEALKKMEREDVVKSATPKILADCENVGNVDAEDLKLLTTTRTIWTTQDLKAQRENPKADLKKYDGVVLYDMIDADFATHFVRRMRTIGFDMFDTNLDLPIGMFENAYSTDIISQRCKTVMLICSEAFFAKKETLFLTQIATLNSIKKNIKVFPIIYKPQVQIKNMPDSIGMISKAVYNPKHYNFWDKIVSSLSSLGTKRVLTEATKKMDFRPEQEEEEEPGSSSQSGVISTSHSTLTSSGACGGGPDADTLVTRLSTSTSISTLGAHTGEIHPFDRMDSMTTTASSIVTAENSGELLLRAPTPPDHDPNSSKGPLKKLKEVFKKKKKTNKQKYEISS